MNVLFLKIFSISVFIFILLASIIFFTENSFGIEDDNESFPSHDTLTTRTLTTRLEKSDESPSSKEKKQLFIVLEDPTTPNSLRLFLLRPLYHPRAQNDNEFLSKEERIHLHHTLLDISQETFPSSLPTVVEKALNAIEKKIDDSSMSEERKRRLTSLKDSTTLHVVRLYVMRCLFRRNDKDDRMHLSTLLLNMNQNEDLKAEDRIEALLNESFPLGHNEAHI